MSTCGQQGAQERAQDRLSELQLRMRLATVGYGKPTLAQNALAPHA